MSSGRAYGGLRPKSNVRSVAALPFGPHIRRISIAGAPASGADRGRSAATLTLDSSPRHASPDPERLKVAPVAAERLNSMVPRRLLLFAASGVLAAASLAGLAAPSSAPAAGPALVA